MPATDIRKTVLEIINETRNRVGLSDAASVSSDSNSLLLLDLLNEVVSEVVDFGDWQEMLVETNVTASVSVNSYSINTSAIVKNIHEIAFEGEISPMKLVTLDDIRRLERTSATGTPRQWAVVGTDSNSNPKFRVYPEPDSTSNNNVFQLLYYTKPSLYTTSDGAIYVPFDSRLIVKGLLAALILDESNGEPTPQFEMYRRQYEEMLKETYNRFNADSGSFTQFTPSTYGRGRY